jgi:hypothetical protein
MKRLLISSGFVALALLLDHAALAAGPQKYSKYEQETIDEVVRDRKVKLDAAPEGKLVEGIDIVRLEVIEQRDPVPNFVNVFHATSKDYVIRRQILQDSGAPWEQSLVDETARNLRSNAQLSVVICVPVQGSSPDRVRLLVITKDVWSLRLNEEFLAGGYGVQEYSLEATEENLAGTQQVVLGRFIYLPQSYTLGVDFFSPRVEGRWISLGADANIIINKNSGNTEGTYGTVGASRPLYSTSTAWSGALTTNWENDVPRRYLNAQVEPFYGGPTLQKNQTPASADLIPYEYRRRVLVNTAAITRSYGKDHKTDVSFGAEMNVHQYQDEDNLSGKDPAAVAQFNNVVLPVSDTRVGPFLQIRHYENRFANLLDVDTLALQENYRLGFDLWARLYPVLRGLGSSRDFIGTFAAAQYSAQLGDGMVRASVELLNEFQTGQNAEDNRISDASIDGTMRVLTPSFGIGRLVWDSSAYNRYRNYSNLTTFLGSDTRLRGYPTSFFSGKDFVVSNLEFRSRSIEILSCQIGGALFYDIGDAFNGYDHLRPYDAAGFGLRALFPQLDRVVLRIDVGFPLTRPLPADSSGIPVPPVAFTFAFRQAFGFPSAGALPGTVPQSVDGSPQTFSDDTYSPGTTPTPLGVLGR